ncbi:MAG: hypothetical protein HRT47_07390 [Candidatus Caenarcaniphilales bacterium]|nr:hypothetical protein [Candidatus Caenarcaniphilales bacterium]
MILNKKTFVYEVVTDVVIDNLKLYSETLEVSSGLFLNFIIFLALVYLIWYWKDRKPDVTPKGLKEGGLFSDEVPKDSTKIDPESDYYTALEKIFNKLEATKSEKQAFAMGVVGSWGSGKTYFAKNLESFIQTKIKDPKEIKPIWFEPWAFNNKANIESRFIDEIIKGLKKCEHYELIHKLRDYESYLNKAEIPPIFSSLFALLNITKNSNEIQKAFKDTFGNKKIYIFIDDLDRLDETEILEIFKLVRSSLSIPNFCFILVYDKARLEELLESNEENSNKNFIDKITQFEFYLPSKGLMSDYFLENYFSKDGDKISAQIIEDYNLSNFDEWLLLTLREVFRKDDSDTKDDYEQIQLKEFKDIFNHYILTIRDLKRVLNKFFVSMGLKYRNDDSFRSKQNEQYIHFNLLRFSIQFALEIMKINYPRVFDELYFEKKNLFLKSDPAFSLYFTREHPLLNKDQHLIKLRDLIFCKSIWEKNELETRFDFQNGKLSKEECRSFQAIRNGEVKHSWKRVQVNEEDLRWEDEYIKRVHEYISKSLGKLNEVLTSGEDGVSVGKDQNLIKKIALLRFEKFAKKNELLCHINHYQNYFKYLNLSYMTGSFVYLDS